MDHTKVPRKLIYEDRANLEDFFIDQPGTLDAIMFDRIQRSMICDLEGAEMWARDIFNNAYYITTLILMEKYPALHLVSYFNISMSVGGGNHTYKRYFSAMTMAMVYNYLRASDQQYYNDQQVLIKRIWDCHREHYQDDQWDGDARFLFYKNVLPLIDVKTHKMRDIFNPRPIQNVVLFEDAETILLGQGLDYVMNSIISLRKTEDAIQCFDELIQKLKRADIIGKGKLIKEVEDCKKEFLGIREEPPIRKGKHGNLIETPQEEEVADVTTYSREGELEAKVLVLQEELDRVRNEKESIENELKESREQLQTIIDEQKKKIEQLKADNQHQKEEFEADRKNNLQPISENSEAEWISCFDGFLHKNLNPQAIAEALKEINHSNFPKNQRGYWWVFTTVLSEINWIPTKNYKQTLQWANLHFHCGWDWNKDSQFKFSEINENIKSIQPSSKWSSVVTGNVIGDYYGALAKTMKNTFVEFVNGGKLIDRIKFIKPECQRINNGH